jgi:serine/threonine-protein kinase
MTMLDPAFLPLQDLLAGRYSIEGELGRGGMGVVLLARDVALERPVAVKVLPTALAVDARARERFLREARTAAGLSHPNIVPIHVVEERGDWVYFVMAFVDGETLRERVERRGPLTPRAAAKLMQEAAWALAYAHERGVVHRDVKPDNIMIERSSDRTIVMDFGIAAVGPPGPAGEVVGTARFMSPEQACGEPVDGRADLYALGATLFFALTGRGPFEAPSAAALLAKHVAEPAPLLTSVQPQVSVPLAAVVQRCLEKDPAGRFQTGEELATALDAVRGRDVRAPPLLRSFLRSAQVATMVFLAFALADGGGDGGNVSINLGPLLVGGVLITNLVAVARRLLREGYSFADIRTALLAEAQVQDEEATVAGQRRWVRRLDGLWHRLWAGRFGRWFFRWAGVGIHAPSRPALSPADHTEHVLARSADDAFRHLTRDQQAALAGLPDAVRRLRAGADALRERTISGDLLNETVATLEHLRVALLRLSAGAAAVEDLTGVLERARDIGHRVDAVLAAGGSDGGDQR